MNRYVLPYLYDSGLAEAYVHVVPRHNQTTTNIVHYQHEEAEKPYSYALSDALLLEETYFFSVTMVLTHQYLSDDEG